MVRKKTWMTKKSTPANRARVDEETWQHFVAFSLSLFCWETIMLLTSDDDDDYEVLLELL